MNITYFCFIYYQVEYILLNDIDDEACFETELARDSLFQLNK